MLNSAEKAQIEMAIAAVERQTRGEIVLLVAESSQFYGWVHAVWGLTGWLVGSLALVLASHLFGAHFTVGRVVFWQAFATNLSALLSFIPGLKRASIPPAQRRRAVEDKAWAGFFAATADGDPACPRAYLFLSFFERCVELQGDSHLRRKVSPEALRVMARSIEQSLGTETWLVACLRAIARLGELLEETAPAVPQNEEDASEGERIYN